MKIIILLLTTFAAFGQIARPTFNPFNNGMMMPNQGYYNNNFAFPNNTNNPLNFHRPNNFQRPQQQYFPQGQSQYFPQQNNNNWQQQQPQVQPQQLAPPQIPLFTRRFHLNNGYLFGRPTLWYDPKTHKMQPWVRKNLR